jgi:hypothetical protein
MYYIAYICFHWVSLEQSDSLYIVLIQQKPDYPPLESRGSPNMGGGHGSWFRRDEHGARRRK